MAIKAVVVWVGLMACAVANADGGERWREYRSDRVVERSSWSEGGREWRRDDDEREYRRRDHSRHDHRYRHRHDCDEVERVVVIREVAPPPVREVIYRDVVVQPSRVQPSYVVQTQGVPQVSDPERAYSGAVIGAVAGGLVGSRVGKGNGRVAASAIGAAVGAVVGDRLQNRSY